MGPGTEPKLSLKTLWQGKLVECAMILRLSLFGQAIAEWQNHAPKGRGELGGVCEAKKSSGPFNRFHFFPEETWVGWLGQVPRSAMPCFGEPKVCGPAC